MKIHSLSVLSHCSWTRAHLHKKALNNVISSKHNNAKNVSLCEIFE